MLREIITKARTHRRFLENVRLSDQFLSNLIEFARFSPSGMNRQPMRFIPVNEPDLNEQVFNTLSWAADLPDWDGPRQGERPAAYIVIVRDTTVVKKQNADGAIMMQSMFLAAAEKEIAGCILASVDRAALRDLFSLDSRYDIEYVLALGKASEKVIIDDCEPGGDITYYRDNQNRHHVPKRSVEELTLTVGRK